MKGGKTLHDKRVRLLREVKTNGGTVFRAGDTGYFYKRGVVRCVFVRDDGATLMASHMNVRDFRVLP
jgi:hypothetical protein